MSVRKAVDTKNLDGVQTEMDKTEGSAMLSLILKKSIVQAGVEVSEVRKRHMSWVNNTDGRVNRLVRSADDAAHAQSQLRALQAQLGAFGGDQNEKSKKVLMGVAANNDKALVQSIFSTWMGFVVKMKSEKGIRDKLEAEIANTEMKLMEYRQAKLNNVRNCLMRKAAENDGNLMTQIWKAWADEVQETKREAGSQEEMKKLEAQLASYSAAQAENTKKVMTRMSAGSDSALLTVVIGSWVQFIEDYKKNKDIEDQVKAQEAKMAEFMKKKKDEAAGVLDKMNAATESGLVEHVISTWCSKFKEDQEAKKMEDLMNGQMDKFASLNGRQKDNAKGVMSRVNELQHLNVMLRHFAAWALDAKLERTMRFYNTKMESKKNQLQSVQSLFKSFASQLDQGLKGESSAPEGDSSRGRKQDGQFLPDIHKRN